MKAWVRRALEQWRRVDQRQHCWPSADRCLKPPSPKSTLGALDLQEQAARILISSHDLAVTWSATRAGDRLPVFPVLALSATDMDCVWLLSTLVIVFCWSLADELDRRARRKVEPHARFVAPLGQPHASFIVWHKRTLHGGLPSILLGARWQLVCQIEFLEERHKDVIRLSRELERHLVVLRCLLQVDDDRAQTRWGFRVYTRRPKRADLQRAQPKTKSDSDGSCSVTGEPLSW